MTADQLILPLEGLFELGANGPAAAALARSLTAAASAGRLAAKDEGSAIAALQLAAAIDRAPNAPLETLIRAHAGLRAWYVALGLTPGGRSGDNGSHGDGPDGSTAPAWAAFGGAELHDPADA
jgi:hypothetical protein